MDMMHNIYPNGRREDCGKLHVFHSFAIEARVDGHQRARH
jgi:hypothetical protein